MTAQLMIPVIEVIVTRSLNAWVEVLPTGRIARENGGQRSLYARTSEETTDNNRSKEDVPFM